MQIAKRNTNIDPFFVMEVSKAASKLSSTLGANDPPVIQLTLGEPDFTAPALVREAAIRAIERGETHYTEACGLEELRVKISQWYKARFGLEISPSRIVVTAGASAALQLVCTLLINPGDKVVMPDPCYPCNRHFVAATDGIPKLVPVTAEERFQLSLPKLMNAWDDQTKGVLLATPSNPTGTSIHQDEMAAIHDFVRSKGGFTVVDEIYLALSHDERFEKSALVISDDIISINSFSKYFSMTGWRLGWVVLPEGFSKFMEVLEQNLYICPSTISQYAALACFEPESIREYERRRREFKKRRDFFITALEKLNFSVPVVPDGAFYIWADCSALFEKLGVQDSWEFAFKLMEKAHIAITPGKDFDKTQGHKFVRFSIANSMENLQESINRMEKLFC